MAKRIYMGQSSSYVNQHLANLIIDKQPPTKEKYEFRNYKTMYSASKAWPLFEFRESPMPQQFIPSVKEKINLIDNGRQQTMTLGLAQIDSILPICPQSITSHLANTHGLISPIRQPTINPKPAQIDSIPSLNQSQQAFNAYENPYTHIPPIKVPNKMLPATIVA